MPRTNDYKQQATYWSAPSENGYGGKSYGAPVLLDVKWEDRQEKFSDFAGETQVSRAVVFVKVDVELGGYLYLGDETGTANPSDLDDSFEIRQFAKIPDIRNVEYERRAFL